MFWSRKATRAAKQRIFPQSKKNWLAKGSANGLSQNGTFLPKMWRHRGFRYRQSPDQSEASRFLHKPILLLNTPYPTSPYNLALTPLLFTYCYYTSVPESISTEKSFDCILGK